MNYSQAIGLIVFISTLVLIFLFVVMDEISLWYRFRGIKSSPPYCRTCGCPIKEIWNREWKEFDPITGVGTSHERLYYRCSKDRWHYNKKSVYKRDIPIEADCQPSYFSKDGTFRTMP